MADLRVMAASLLLIGSQIAAAQQAAPAAPGAAEPGRVSWSSPTRRKYELFPAGHQAVLQAQPVVPVPVILNGATANRRPGNRPSRRTPQGQLNGVSEHR